jgi:hypothetical protein
MWDIKTLKKTFNLNKLYKEYNARFFKDKLGEVVFDVYVQGKDEIPTYAFENARKKRTGGYTGNIKFNALCEWDEHSIRKILLHEMVHYYHFVLFKTYLFFPHGIPFMLTQLRLLLFHGVYVPNFGGPKIKMEKEES